jgi:hypothetical protein
MLQKTVITLLLLVGSFSFVQAQSEWSEKELQDLYTNFLSAEGFENWVDDDGDVQFKYNNRTYFVEVNENDPEFFRVVLFNIWPIESEAEALQVSQACNVVNRQMKCTKAYMTDADNVWLAVELFVGKPDAFKPIFQRCLGAIEQGVDTFVEEM